MKIFTKNEETYPILIADIMKHIDKIKQLNIDKDCSLIDIILDFSFKNGLDIELVGGAIRSDIYFKSFVEKDCEYHSIIKSKKSSSVENW